MQDVSKARLQTQIMGGEKTTIQQAVCVCVRERACVWDWVQLCGGLLHHRGESYSLTEEDWGGHWGKGRERERGGEENKNMVSVRAGEKKNK